MRISLRDVLVFLIIVVVFIATLNIAREEVKKEQMQDAHMEKVHESLERLGKLEAEMDKLEGKIDDFLDKWNLEIFESTAYSPFDNQGGICADGNPEITALGYRPGYGNFAVDFSVIPKHAKMYVEGEGVGIAADTGGAIKGRRVDVFRESYRGAMSYGRRQVKVAWENDR